MPRGGILLDLISGGYQAPKPVYDPLAAIMAAPKASKNERYWREKLAKRGDRISAPAKSLGNTLERTVANALGRAGMGERDAARVSGKATRILNDLTPVGDAMSADNARVAWNEGRYGSAAGNALLAAIGAVPGLGDAAAPAMKAMFLGVKARNADLGALKRAEEMAASGVGRDDIWAETGWGRGVDGKWRFEIPDNNITIDKWKIDPAREAQRGVNSYMKKHYGVEDFTRLPNDSPQRIEANSLYEGFKANAAKKTQLFDDVAQHPELLEAYPAFKNIGVGPETRYNLGGSWTEDAGTLRVRPTSENANSILGHELQHAVQGEEGFARGGMPEQFQRELDGQIRDLNAELAAVHSKLVRAGGRNSPSAAPFAQEYDRILRDREALVNQDTRELYRRLAGEVEARTVEKRLYMDPQARRDAGPWWDYDVPEDKQIVRFR